MGVFSPFLACFAIFEHIFHELNEAFPSMLDENGDQKTFERFLNDVRSIDRTYNVNYLRAEYNFISASAEMAAKWEEFARDGDRYNLQYRIQKDNKVRPEHVVLDGVTLPHSDPFWEEFYPPNGWNCRCTVVQVRKSKYPATSHDDAMRLGQQALQKDTKGMFRFNPGVERKTVPDYNPYTIRRCRDCDLKSDNLAHVPTNQLCAACKLVHKMLEPYTIVPTTKGRVRIHENHGKGEKKENISRASYFAERYGHEVDLLPNPPHEKSADVFNRTLGIEQEYKVNTKPTKSTIDNEVRSAAKQADDIVLRIDSNVTLEALRDGIHDRVNRCNNIHSVTIIRDNMDITYTREQILERDFKIRQEDFK